MIKCADGLVVAIQSELKDLERSGVFERLNVFEHCNDLASEHIETIFNSSYDKMAYKMNQLNTRNTVSDKMIILTVPYGCSVGIPTSMLNDIDKIKLIREIGYQGDQREFASDKRVINIVEASEILPMKPSADIIAKRKEEIKAKLKQELKALEAE